jgi:hypothetical protein
LRKIRESFAPGAGTDQKKRQPKLDEFFESGELDKNHWEKFEDDLFISYLKYKREQEDDPFDETDILELTEGLKKRIMRHEGIE